MARSPPFIQPRGKPPTVQTPEEQSGTVERPARKRWFFVWLFFHY